MIQPLTENSFFCGQQSLFSLRAQRLHSGLCQALWPPARGQGLQRGRRERAQHGPPGHGQYTKQCWVAYAPGTSTGRQQRPCCCCCVPGLAAKPHLQAEDDDCPGGRRPGGRGACSRHKSSLPRLGATAPDCSKCACSGQPKSL